MPRQARLVNPIGCYHVMMRGNNRHPIFERRDDKEYFLKTLHQHCGEDAQTIVAFCLMDNHIHIVLRAPSDTFSRALGRTSIKFAMRYNGRQKRCGHVFQDRFRSEIIDDPQYLLAAIRYVHNNPVKAKLVEYPREYKWSSYTEYLGESVFTDREQKERVLAEHFGGNIAQFISFHRQHDDHEFLEDKVDLEEQRVEHGRRVLTAYCEGNGIANVREAYNDPEKLVAIVLHIITHSRLRHRQVADLLGVSSSRVHKIASQHSRLEQVAQKIEVSKR